VIEYNRNKYQIQFVFFILKLCDPYSGWPRWPLFPFHRL